MFGEIKDLATLKMRALELATGQVVTGIQTNVLLPDPKEVVERAKVYEEYLRDGVNLQDTTNNLQGLISPLTYMSILLSLKSEGREITPEMRIFLEKSGVDPAILDALCGKQAENEEKKVDDLIDKVNESREIHYNCGILKEWIYPELRNEKHRYEIIRNGKVLSKGDFLNVALFENL